MLFLHDFLLQNEMKIFQKNSFTVKLCMAFIAVLFITAADLVSTVKKVSVHVESKSLNQGKVIHTIADIFYNIEAKK